MLFVNGPYAKRWALRQWLSAYAYTRVHIDHPFPCRYNVSMSTKVQKWGNSLAVRIPDDVVEDMGLVPGKEVTVRKVRNTVVIAPVQTKKEKRPTLEELVAKITPENRHDEIDWGAPMGKEAW